MSSVHRIDEVYTHDNIDLIEVTIRRDKIEPGTQIVLVFKGKQPIVVTYQEIEEESESHE